MGIAAWLQEKLIHCIIPHTMHVECPHCQTVFKLTEAQLQIADGLVRCGMCQEVFDALADKRDSKTGTPTANTATAETVKPTESPKQEPVVKAAAKTSEAVTTQPQSAPRRAQTRPSSEDLFDGVQSKLIPDQFRIPELHTPYSVWHDASWGIAILILTVALFVQLAWFNRNNFVADPQLKPWVMKLCDSMNCDDLSLKDPDQIEMINRNIYSHPNMNNALMISVTMVNHATFSQPYPSIQLDFSDVRGEVIASRIFTPEQYLQLHKNSIRLLASEAPVDFGLEIQDPGPEAMTYEFDFL